MNEYYEDLLVLAILSNKAHADANLLCVGLSRKFGIINCNEIINRIEVKGYVNVSYPGSKTLKFFTLTETGKSLLESETVILSKVLKDNFPEQVNYISVLLS